MKTKLTPYYIDLIYDTCLKSFWRKPALAKFLRRCSISDSFLATWGAEESKRSLLDRLFVELPKTEKGRNGLLRIAESLIEQRSFPDLENWEDSCKKIKDAHDAVLKLRILHEQQNEEIQSEEEKRKARETFKKKQDEVSRSQKSMKELSAQLADMSKRLGSQQAGYDFQSWFFSLLDYSEIPNRKPYVHAGRQIDGSLTLAGTTYLVELKFTASQAEATDIDTFYKKVTNKADNTMGIMISISGYSTIAKKEASGPRTPLLLLDHSHIFMVLGEIMSLSDVIDRIRRHASQTGEAFLAASEFTA
jgi:hypothetical protein